jgi:hypothetical protein
VFRRVEESHVKGFVAAMRSTHQRIVLRFFGKVGYKLFIIWNGDLCAATNPLTLLYKTPGKHGKPPFT